MLFIRLQAAAFFALAFFLSAQAQTTGAPNAGEASAQQRKETLQSAWQAAAKVAQNGPTSVPLAGQASFSLNKGQAFIPQPQAGDIMRAYGNQVDTTFIGLVIPENDAETWMATVSFIREGYVKDEDAKNWNADDLLSNLKEGTQQSNKFRRERGFPALLVEGWIEAPAYDAASHRLVWALSAVSEGRPADEARTVNYNTYQLGREGFFSLNMLTNSREVGDHKTIARGLLGGLSFDIGKRYEDFNASTDTIATYGLAALVGGAALKKAGFFALLMAFALKFWKLALVGVVMLGLGIKRLFSNKGAAS